MNSSRHTAELNRASAEHDRVVAPFGMSRGEKPSRAYVWYVIALLSLVNAFNYIDRTALSVLMPQIKTDLRLSDGQLGVLVGLAFAVFYAICAVPIARWADRGSRRNIIALALAAWSVATVLSGAAQSFGQLFAARVGVGAGEAGCLPPAQSILCDYVPVRQRAGAFAIHTCGLILGMMLGLVVGGWLGERLGWRWAFVALGVPGVAFAAVVRLTLREPVRGFFDPPRRSNNDIVSKQTAMATLRFLARCRTYRLLTVVLVANGFYQFGLISWWPSFYSRLHTLSVTSVGVYLGVAIGAGSGVGLLLGGLLAGRTTKRNIASPLMIGASSTALALPAGLGVQFSPSAAGSLCLVALTSCLWSVAGGPVLAAVYSVTLPWMRATAGAITILFTSVLGFGLGPMCVGLLSDLLAPAFGADAIRYAMLVPIGVIPVMALVLRAAAHTFPQDLRAAGVLSEDQNSSGRSVQ